MSLSLEEVMEEFRRNGRDVDPDNDLADEISQFNLGTRRPRPQFGLALLDRQRQFERALKIGQYQSFSSSTFAVYSVRNNCQTNWKTNEHPSQFRSETSENCRKYTVEHQSQTWATLSCSIERPGHRAASKSESKIETAPTSEQRSSVGSVRPNNRSLNNVLQPLPNGRSKKFPNVEGFKNGLEVPRCPRGVGAVSSENSPPMKEESRKFAKTAVAHRSPSSPHDGEELWLNHKSSTLSRFEPTVLKNNSKIRSGLAVASTEQNAKNAEMQSQALLAALRPSKLQKGTTYASVVSKKLSGTSTSRSVIKQVENFFQKMAPSVEDDRAPECVFCRTNGETAAMYRNHVLKDEFGQTTCAILQKYVCPLCGATGKQAHTVKYCPKNFNPPQIATMTTLKAMRSSTGIVRMPGSVRRASITPERKIAPKSLP